MEFQHKPVLLEETISNLAIKPDGVYIDGTVGGAGHSGEILKRLDESGTLIGLDQDEFAIKTSQEKLVQINSKAKIILVNTNFVNIKEVCQKTILSLWTAYFWIWGFPPTSLMKLPGDLATTKTLH